MAQGEEASDFSILGMSLTFLPSPVLKDIFKFFELNHCAVALSDREIFKAFYNPADLPEREMEMLSSDVALKVLAKQKLLRNVGRVCIEGCWPFAGNAESFTHGMLFLGKALPYIRHLHLDEIPESSAAYEAIVLACPHLRSLEFTSPWEAGLKKLAPLNLHELWTGFSMESGMLSIIRKQWPWLRTLHFSSCSDDIDLSLLRHLPLQNFSIEGDYPCDKLLILLSTLKQLKEFTIRSGFQYADDKEPPDANGMWSPKESQIAELLLATTHVRTVRLAVEKSDDFQLVYPYVLSSADFEAMLKHNAVQEVELDRDATSDFSLASWFALVQSSIRRLNAPSLTSELLFELRRRKASHMTVTRNFMS